MAKLPRNSLFVRPMHKGCEGHGTLHHLLEVIHDDCEAAVSAPQFKALCQELLHGVQIRSCLDFARGAYNWKLYFPLRLDFAHDPSSHRINVSGAEDGFRTLQEHYLCCFSIGSRLPERALVSYEIGGGDSCLLLPQHLYPYGEEHSYSDRAQVDVFNRHVQRIRRRLHWPRMKLLLLGCEGGAAHGGLGLLSMDLARVVGRHLLAGTADSAGRLTAGMYSPGFELDPRAWGVSC